MIYRFTLVEKLLKLGYEVRVLDNLSSGSSQMKDRLEKFYNEAVAIKI